MCLLDCGYSHSVLCARHRSHGRSPEHLDFPARHDKQALEIRLRSTPELARLVPLGLAPDDGRLVVLEQGKASLRQLRQARPSSASSIHFTFLARHCIQAMGDLAIGDCTDIIKEMRMVNRISVGCTVEEKPRPAGGSAREVDSLPGGSRLWPT